MKVDVPWPLNGSASWWSERYLVATFGVAGTFGQSLTMVGRTERYPGYDTDAVPFLYLGAHIYPFPTDRRIPREDRVQKPGQWFHIALAGALTDPWPEANTRSGLGIKGFLAGVGASFRDNLISVSVGAVVGRGLFKEVDIVGVTRARGLALISPFLSLSSQADVAKLIGELAGKR